MDKYSVIGNWNILKGKIQQTWARLTDDDIKRIEGNIDELSGRLQKTYGYTKEQAESEVVRFKTDSMGTNSMRDDDAAILDRQSIAQQLQPDHKLRN